MDARYPTSLAIALALLCTGASYRTTNFIVTASTPQLAREIAEKAEDDRRRLAIEWLGHELPPWSEPCPITAHVAPNLGAGGATSFMFDRGRPFGWTMTIQGSRERVLDSVLPHEVTHTIFATHFGRPLPRWADEGACTTVEHEAERKKQEHMLITFLTSNRGIAFNRMFAMQEYPRDVLPLYAQGYSLARFLIAQGGKRKFVQYIGDGMQTNNWPEATRRHYGYRDLSELQLTWLDWVRRGCPAIESPGQPATLLADAVLPRPVPHDVAPDGAEENVGTSAQEPAAPLVPVQPPANQLAEAVEIRSWYIEQRDLALARRAGTAEDVSREPAVPLAADTYCPGSIKRAVSPGGEVVTRPQPVGTPRQTVIDWGSAAAAEPNTNRPNRLLDASLVDPTKLLR